MSRETISWILIPPMALLLGCSRGRGADESKVSAKQNPATVVAPAAPAAPAAPVADMVAAKKVFDERCTVCHGVKGLGDGPAAQTLTPKPRAFSDSTWQTSVTDKQIEQTIIAGGAAVGKSPLMPGNPDLKTKPEVVRGLLEVIRGYKTVASAQ